MAMLHATNGRSRSSGLRNGRNGSERENEPSKDDLALMQARAFLGACEDVDIDPETFEDLMEALPSDDGEDTERDEPRANGCTSLRGNNDSDSDEEQDLSALYLRDKDDSSQGMHWSQCEIKNMTQYLKERGMDAFLMEYVYFRNNTILELLPAFGITLCEELRNKKGSTHLYFLKVALARILRHRERLTQYNTIADAVRLIKKSSRILVLTGAGISVSCGIPDFRSRDGLYASLNDRDDYDMDDPQQMFDINYFRENPAVFYSFAHEIYPSKFKPSPCHRFIKLLEQNHRLLRNYTQNIDTLESVVGVERVLQCHGSFTSATCLQCRQQVTISGSQVEDDILAQKVSLCTICNPPSRSSSTTPKRKKRVSSGGAKRKRAKGGSRDWEWESEEDESDERMKYPSGIMKPDITFFGEKLNAEFDTALDQDREQVDLLLVIGTSLKVSPVADILSHLPHSVPQILINKTPIRHINPDIMLLGNADDIVRHLCDELKWELPPAYPQQNNNREHLRRTAANTTDPSVPSVRLPERVGQSHVWLYDGAEGGRWLQDFKRELERKAPILASPAPAEKTAGEGTFKSKRWMPVCMPCTG